MTLVDPGIGSSLDVSFTGVANCDLKRYTLYWGPALNHTQFSMNIATSPTSNIRISGLTPNTLYYVSVSATNTSLNESPRSAEAQGTPRLTNGGIRPAASVGNLKLVKSGVSDIRLNWTPVTTDIFGVTTPLTGQRVYRADLRGPGGYDFNVFSLPWPRAGFLDAPASQPLTAASITWVDSGANGGALSTLSLAYLILESNGQGDGAASADLPQGVLDLKLWKSTLTPGWLDGGFSPVTADLSGTPLPAPPVYRVYRYTTRPIVFDRSSAHAGSVGTLNGSICEGAARYCNAADLPGTTSYYYAILVEDGHGSSSPY